MREFRLRTDLERAVIDGFALPLGLVPGESARVVAPTPGYTIDFHTGEDEEPDSYTIYAVASHERVADLVERMFDLLSDEVCGIVEIGSRDAYRTLDVYMAQEPTSHVPPPTVVRRSRGIGALASESLRARFRGRPTFPPARRRPGAVNRYQ